MRYGWLLLSTLLLSLLLSCSPTDLPTGLPTPPTDETPGDTPTDEPGTPSPDVPSPDTPPPPNPTPPPEPQEPSDPRNAVKLWSDPATWGGELPAAGATVDIEADQSILLDVSPPSLAGLRVQGDLIFDKQDIELTSDWIVVEGLLQAGTPDEPYTNRAVITLTGNADNPFSAGIGVKALGVLNEGSLELHGAARLSWTQLGATAEPGDSSITLAQDHNWRAGDDIVIASTDYDFEQAEKRTVTKTEGRKIFFDEPLAYMHYGELQEYGGKTLDQRAEVGLLTRNIIIQGDEKSTENGLGGHIIARDNANLSLAQIELVNMGQRGELGRYPVHWHMMGEGSSGSYLKNASIHNSFNRCVTIHASNGVILEDNVAYDAPGHCYFLEDGNEQNNVLRGNLGMLTRKPDGDALLVSDNAVLGPATFWITHPNNTVEGNVAAGSEGSGFWYALPEQPTGESAGSKDTASRYAPLGSFKGNKAHSSLINGLHIDNAPRAGVNAALDLGPYLPRTDPKDPKTSVTATFEDFTSYKNRSHGFWSRGVNHVFDNFMLADNRMGSVMAADNAVVKNSVYVGDSANKGTPSDYESRNGLVAADGRTLPIPNQPELDTFGFGFYDGTVALIDSYLTNYASDDLREEGALSVQHFTPFGLKPSNYASGVRFGDGTQRVNLPRLEYQAGDKTTGDTYRTAVFNDRDGSVTGQSGADVVAETPLLLNGNCSKRDDMVGVRICNSNDYGALHITTRGKRDSVTLNVAGGSHTLNGTPRSPSSIFRGNVLLGRPYQVEVAGGLGGGLEFRLKDAAEKSAELNLALGSAPTVKRAGGANLEPAESLGAMRNSESSSYFYAAGTLHLKLVNEIPLFIQ